LEEARCCIPRTQPLDGLHAINNKIIAGYDVCDCSDRDANDTLRTINRIYLDTFVQAQEKNTNWEF
jgi:hypothetical protein